MTTTKKLLAIFAHPDDEAFGTGGTLSKCAAEGVDVHLIIATNGDAGQISDPNLATPETLGRVREQELRQACDCYGINSPYLLGYPDGKLTVVDQKEAVGKIVQLIRTIQPQVVLTFGPDGIYGHYDHLACHRWATIAVRLAADADWFPEHFTEEVQPHTVSKVYFRATSQSWIDTMRQNGGGDVMMHGVPFSFFGYPDEQITTQIDIRPYARLKQRGILSHATQIKDTSRFEGEAALDQPIFQVETFIRTYSSVPVDETTIEANLFAGL